MERQPLGNTIYVAIVQPGETRSHVGQMFRGITKAFVFEGMTFSLLGRSLTVTGVRGKHSSIIHLDEPLEIENSSGFAFCVAVHPTEPRATAFIAEEGARSTVPT